MMWGLCVCWGAGAGGVGLPAGHSRAGLLQQAAPVPGEMGGLGFSEISEGGRVSWIYRSYWPGHRLSKTGDIFCMI